MVEFARWTNTILISGEKSNRDRDNYSYINVLFDKKDPQHWLIQNILKNVYYIIDPASIYYM